MKRILFAFCLILSLVVALPAAQADNLSIDGLNTLVYGETQYGGEYVGPIGSALNAATITGGITCLDINTPTYVPNAGFEVYVSTLSPVDLTHARFASDPYTPAQLFRYQEAAALLGQMPSHTDQIGPIQFAVWRIFDPAHASGPNPAAEQYWLDWAAAINVNDFNFSSVRIYTPADTVNQEFMSGAAAAVPIPGAVLLLGAGLARLAAYARRRQNA